MIFYEILVFLKFNSKESRRMHIIMKKSIKSAQFDIDRIQFDMRQAVVINAFNQIIVINTQPFSIASKPRLLL